MMTLHNWMNDIPQQFHSKKNIEILISVFSKQIDELYQVYEDLKFATTLENAKGQNLMYIGDILSTSLNDAQNILMNSSNEEITREVYRKILQYKALQNNCDCTYFDIMESINLLWDTDNVKYSEPEDRPATIYLSLPEANIDGVDPAVGRILAIKPAGVAMIYTIGYATGINISGTEKVRLSRIMITTSLANEEKATVPEIQLLTKSKINETVSASIVSKRNLWMLDGTYLLDGSKLLNAVRIEEDL